MLRVDWLQLHNTFMECWMWFVVGISIVAVVVVGTAVGCGRAAIIAAHNLCCCWYWGCSSSSSRSWATTTPTEDLLLLFMNPIAWHAAVIYLSSACESCISSCTTICSMSNSNTNNSNKTPGREISCKGFMFYNIEWMSFEIWHSHIAVNRQHHHAVVTYCHAFKLGSPPSPTRRPPWVPLSPSSFYGMFVALHNYTVRILVVFSFGTIRVHLCQ